MVDNNQTTLSVRRQCELLGIHRQNLYYRSKNKRDDAAMMAQILQLWRQYPMYGYRKITAMLRRGGIKISRKRVQRLMQRLGICALYAKPRASKVKKTHAVYPYLLKELEISSPNQVWAVDITYIQRPVGHLYLFAIIDVYSRYIVGWSLSNTLEAAPCIAALNACIERVKPDVVNSDQGCQFTSAEWINLLQQEGVAISMDGKGRCLDNIYIERFWRSLKYEEIYQQDCDSGVAFKQSIEKYIAFYNHVRVHEALNYQTPAECYFMSGDHNAETVVHYSRKRVA